MSQWYKPGKPGEIKPIPWLAPEAIAYLESIVKPEFEIIEHGSGGSTLWFAERCKKVWAYENDPEWQAIIQKNAPENVVINVKAREECDYDLLLIDGEPVTLRTWWLIVAPKLIRPGGWIVLDNANRPEYDKEREGLKQFATLEKTINSNGKTGHLYLVTEFWRVKCD